jgi:hypothetical protein
MVERKDLSATVKIGSLVKEFVFKRLPQATEHWVRDYLHHDAHRTLCDRRRQDEFWPFFDTPALKQRMPSLAHRRAKLLPTVG